MEETSTVNVEKTQNAINAQVTRLDFGNILATDGTKYSTQIYNVMNNLKNPNLGSIISAAYFRSCLRFLHKLDDAAYRPLILCLIKYEWYLKDYFVGNEYSNFVSSVVAMDNAYAEEVFSRLLTVLTGSVLRSNGNPETTDHIHQRRDTIFSQALLVIRNVLSNAPSTIQYLENVFDSSFPSYRRSVYEIECYTENAFNLIRLLPTTSRMKFLSLVIGKLRVLDSYIDVTLYQSADDVSVHTDDSVDAVGSLDKAMKSLLDYIYSQCYDNNQRFVRKSAKSLFSELLGIFEMHILKSVSSAQLQFFILYICSFHEDFTYGLIGFLWKKLNDESYGESYKQKAIWYISDVLSRMKTVNTEIVMMNVKQMTDWCHDYVFQYNQRRGQVFGVCFETHKLFYSMIHGVFHVILDRRDDFIKEIGFLKRIHINCLISSDLNPLYFGDDSFLCELSNFLRDIEIAYCHSVIEDNRRDQIRSQKELQTKRVVMKFPFSKYYLPSTVTLFTNVLSAPDLNSTNRRYRDMSISTMSDDQNFEDDHMYGISPPSSYVHDVLLRNL